MPKNRIHKLGDGRYSYSFIIDGHRHHAKSRKGETLADFRRRVDRMEAAAGTSNSRLTLNEAFTLWQEKYQQAACSASDKRVTDYAYNRFVRAPLGGRAISEITRQDIHRLLNQLIRKGYSRSTVGKVRAAVSRTYSWAINVLGAKAENPCLGLRLKFPRQNKKAESRYITPEEMEKFREAAKNSKYYPYFELLRLTGLRPSEGLGLQWQDITPEGLRIQRAYTADGEGALKTPNAYRTIPITPKLQDVLDFIPVTDKWFFPAESGEPSYNAVRCALERIDGPKIRLYDFRHTFASTVAPHLPPKSLQTLMGHGDINVTLNYYVEMTPADYDKAQEILADVL